jgi:Protein of unknown function (DUF541)
LRNNRRIRRLALIASLIFLAVLPAQAAGQGYGPGFPTEEEYGPGITVGGAGFAPVGHRDRATARAVADARRRADAIAAALGVSTGSATAVEVNTPFEPRTRCEGRSTGRCAPLEAVSVTTTFAISGGATDDEGAREIEGSGAAFARPEVERETSPAIRSALLATRLEVTPEAAKTARANAEGAAAPTGIQLGPLFAVVESANLYGYEPLLGNFGPGQFCGFVRRGRIRVDPETGRRRFVRLKRVRRCYRPTVYVRLDVVYLGA